MSDTTETMTTDNLLYFSISLSSFVLTFGLIISFAIDEDPAIKNESALEITAASNITIINITSVNGNTDCTT